MHEVIITDYLSAPAEVEERELNGVAQVRCLQARSIDELSGKLSNAHGLILYHEVSLPARIIEELNRCQVIARAGVGFDNIDLQAASAKGIRVCNVPDYGVDEVADHAIGLMLCCNRGFIRAERHLRQTLEPWNHHGVEPTWRLAGKTLGIVGLGRIGSATAARAKAFKMNVIAFDPYLRPGLDKVMGVKLVDWEELLAESDVVSCHTPLTDETRGLIDAEALSKMKPAALLINTSRGEIVDVEALADALEQGKILGAGIDVLPVEPPDPESRLVKLWRRESDPPVNLIITPHSAFYSDMALMEIRVKSSQEIRRVLTGERPRSCVNANDLDRN